ncbi:1-phosphofructokinase family hexose kinase [Nonomuraea sp. NPDC059023]|uniref:1-phosphofructokinase family hexose kinase n=1 Tax=unclassified Nonomuraea TaxID=2593643 RepID=UPI0036B76995
MIVTVTLNAALDTTYRVGAVDWDGVNRVSAVHRRAGGKGVNVARVLAALGHDVLAVGLAGGPTGQAVLSDLDSAGLAHAFTPIAGESRATLVISAHPAYPPAAEDPSGGGDPSSAGGLSGAGGFAGTAVPAAGRTALFNEPGPEVTPDELRNFVMSYEARVKAADAVVISGSLPRGVPADFYATLALIAARHGVPAIVDADGEPLRHAPTGRPTIVKPNHEELARAVPGGTPAEGAQALRSRGAESVVVSMGKDGLLAVTPEGDFRARMPYTVAGNPTGAGDALVAGLALGLVEAAAWPERLRRAAALGAAAVAAPVAGDFDHNVYTDIHPKIDIS